MHSNKSKTFAKAKSVVASTIFIVALSAAPPWVSAATPTPTVCSNGVIVYTGACPAVKKVVNRCAGQVGQALTDCKNFNLASCIPLPAGAEKDACIKLYSN